MAIACTKFGQDRASSSGDTLANIQTNKQTDRQTDAHHNTPLPHRGRIKNAGTLGG